MADPSVTPAGVRAVGAVLLVRVRHHHVDGLTELDANGTRLFLPRISHQPGEDLRIRIPAQEVILSTIAPTGGLSALNVLSGTVESIRSGEGPGAIVSVRTNAGIVLARVTRRSVGALHLQPGFAVPCDHQDRGTGAAGCRRARHARSINVPGVGKPSDFVPCNAHL